MREVAEAAGVSLKTVSRVVNSEPGVGPETAQRVREAIASLGFRRNDLASSLRRGRSSATLGLVIEDATNPFYSAIAHAVEEVARARQYLVLIGSCEEDARRERELTIALCQRRVDGLLIVPAGHDHSYLLPELQLGTAAVFLDRPPGRIEADAVLLDNEGGARRAVEHLLAQGHRRIAHIADPPALYTAAERLKGYRAALASAGIPFDEGLVRVGIHDAPQAEAVARQLLAEPNGGRPTAFFTGNNRLTVGVLRAMRDLDRPVALVGFDDFELADMLSVSVVKHDPSVIGRRAAELVFARLGGTGDPPQRVIVETEVLARGSGEVAP
jgi:LacI family transcriptional regulator